MPMTTPPTEADALAMVTFSPEDGRIWFNHRRMMMLDTVSFSTLRDRLIRHLGARAARALLTQVGYRSGVSDAQMLRRDWPHDFHERSRIGPRFHGVAGIAKVEPVRTDFRPQEGYFSGEFVWRHTVEDDAHIRTQGLGTEPACWMELGYATGYLSTVCDRLILVREFECRSMGSASCRVAARPLDEWDEVEEDLFFLGLNRDGSAADTAADVPADASIRNGRGEAPASAALSPAARTPVDEDRVVVGESAALQAALGLVRKVAPTRASVLLTGESGAGKELFARLVHRLSPRAGRPFVAINCAAIPESLIESELFGVARGGFTGAVQSRAGRFERAEGGTLFLDEIGTLSLAAQAKLLRVLQEHEVERVGSTSTCKVDVRIVAATNASLRAAVERGSFREDLFYRLNVFPIHLPPLRERRDDIPALIDHMLRRFGTLHGKRVTHLSSRAMRALLNHRFPGNIRELENLIERALILAEGDCIDLPHLAFDGPSADPALYAVDATGRLVHVRAQARDDDADRMRVAGTGPQATTSSGVASSAGALASPGAAAAPVLAASSAVAPLAAWAERTVDACARGVACDLASIEQEVAATLARTALARSNGNVSAAARLLGVRRHQLEYRLKARTPVVAQTGPRHDPATTG